MSRLSGARRASFALASCVSGPRRRSTRCKRHGRTVALTMSSGVDLGPAESLATCTGEHALSGSASATSDAVDIPGLLARRHRKIRRNRGAGADRGLARIPTAFDRYGSPHRCSACDRTTDSCAHSLGVFRGLPRSQTGCARRRLRQRRPSGCRESWPKILEHLFSRLCLYARAQEGLSWARSDWCPDAAAPIRYDSGATILSPFNPTQMA